MAYETAGTPRDDSSPECSRAKWLALGGIPGQAWPLHDDTNLDVLEVQIKTAMRSGDALTVELPSDEESIGRRLVLNGNALPVVLLFEQRKP